MKLMFEKSVAGRGTHYLPALDVQEPEDLDPKFARQSDLDLPELSEVDVDRHYSELDRATFGVNNGIYMLGSCTMKYNPPVHELIVNRPEWAGLHPLQPEDSAQGALEAIGTLEHYLAEISGMNVVTFQPVAGAHGELVGLLTIRAYLESKGEGDRKVIFVPDAAHGTNPASASMAGFEIKAIPVFEDGSIDLDKLKEVAGPDTAGLMLTNPNTEGHFETGIREVCDIIHEAGGCCYYDGANLNAVMGVVRPGDMGFDLIHFNLHKTFSTPHGGGGPGACAVGAKEFLEEFLPGERAVKNGDTWEWETPAHSIGRVSTFHGNFLVMLRALSYVLTLGADGIRYTAQNAVLNANYMMFALKDLFPMASPDRCMHEFVASASKLKKETGVTAMDISKALLDYGVHPPTMYFPLTIPEALMVEPTETEPKETLDYAIKAFREIVELAHTDPEKVIGAPYTTPIARPDDVEAARHPILKYVPEEA
ncbi:MAG: aminomethyl-transferring glycine dehydrogenase subunit GcvPB [Actinomycetaceae bacterium]|nr:aminomethyl-transferring glycine dehydrogenase subunit GcvPB [Actinomycetaceae bacterium]MDY6082738.1 aminomethyl-transferring glycine dehydrogenase subunit GcvPB [Actinomycetaceae bacterium]